MNKVTGTFFRVPNDYRLRLHIVRARYKNNIENVLLYMAHECCKIGVLPCKEYRKKYFNSILAFPGNIGKKAKTLENWRTELPALFGFYIEDKDVDKTTPSKMAYFLDEQQDLPQFLKFFLYSFQFPGGHLKPQEIAPLIDNGVRFKPAKLFLEVLEAGNRILSANKGMYKYEEMSLSKEEATYCIFDDIRVTSGQTTPKDVAKTILDNRLNKRKYYDPSDRFIFKSSGEPRSKGDVVRQAGDILDIMVLAGMIEESHGYYYLHTNDYSTIKTFLEDKTFFKGYDSFYNGKYTIEEIASVEPQWFDYVSDSLKTDLFSTDISTLFQEEGEVQVVWDEQVRELLNDPNRNTKSIGNVGEAIICGHEKMRLKISGYEEFVNLVRIVDLPSFRPGYDIESREGDGTKQIRYVEVKTTISKKHIDLYGFHMSTHEWDVAETNGHHYCVYRLMLSSEDKILYILRDPVNLYKTDQIEASPREGMEITFNKDNFERSKLLQWKR